MHTKTVVMAKKKKKEKLVTFPKKGKKLKLYYARTAESMPIVRGDVIKVMLLGNSRSQAYVIAKTYFDKNSASNRFTVSRVKLRRGGMIESVCEYASTDSPIK